MVDADSIMLTTTDNPYNPFTQFDQWRTFDETHGYYTMPYLARVAVSSDELSEADQSLATLDAIKEILIENDLGIYKVVDGEFNIVLLGDL